MLASEKACGMCPIVSPLNPSAPVSRISSAIAGMSVSLLCRDPCVELSHGLYGHSTLTPRVWSCSTTILMPSVPPGSERIISN